CPLARTPCERASRPSAARHAPAPSATLGGCRQRGGSRVDQPFGSLAIRRRFGAGPMALRPTLTGGVPLSRNPVEVCRNPAQNRRSAPGGRSGEPYESSTPTGPIMGSESTPVKRTIDSAVGGRDVRKQPGDEAEEDAHEVGLEVLAGAVAQDGAGLGD